MSLSASISSLRAESSEEEEGGGEEGGGEEMKQ